MFKKIKKAALKKQNMLIELQVLTLGVEVPKDTVFQILWVRGPLKEQGQQIKVNPKDKKYTTSDSF